MELFNRLQFGNKEANIREICPLHALLSINGLLLLHIYKWRAAVSRIWFMVFLHYLH